MRSGVLLLWLRVCQLRRQTRRRTGARARLVGLLCQSCRTRMSPIGVRSTKVASRVMLELVRIGAPLMTHLLLPAWRLMTAS